MSQPIESMAAPFPKIRVGDRIEIIEVDECIGRAVDDRQRRRMRFHRELLVDARTFARRFKYSLAKPAIGTSRGLAKACFRHSTENLHEESVAILDRPLLLRGG
jgi:hypothetical protein